MWATGKIINLHIPELYSVVRGKVGNAVEFGLSWGLTRLRGGFVLATMAAERGDLQDSSRSGTTCAAFRVRGIVAREWRVQARNRNAV